MLFTVCNLYSQITKDTILLPEVILEESKIKNFTVGVNYEIFNPLLVGLASTTTLSEYLTNFSNIYIKEYGALATPAFRGTSSSHTNVLWNGIPINSLANGLVDFSAINMLNNHQIVSVSSGNSSSFGSGSIGGSIHFNAALEQVKKNKIIFTRKIGSFGLSSNTLNIYALKNKISFFGSFSSINDKNNFKFKNTSVIGNPYQINDYGKKHINEYNFNVKYQINKKQSLLANYWHNYSDREVPQNLSTSISDAKQYDINNRLLITSINNFNAFKLKLKQAYLNENFRYTELSKGIDSRYIAESLISDLNLQYNINNKLFTLGSSLNLNSIENNNYLEQNTSENQIALFGAVDFIFNSFKINSSLRKEWENNYSVPLLPSLSSEFNLNKKNKIKIKYSKNFRAPSFNDRYWISSSSIGNENLNSESSDNYEFGYNHINKNYNLDISCYSLNVYDWIAWIENNGIWSPENLKEVWSRGIESKFKIKYRKSTIQLNYSFTKTTTESSFNTNDISIGQQLRYVPLHKGNIVISYKHKELRYYLNSAYTGEVITSYGSTNSQLEEYIISSFGLIYNPKTSPLETEFRIMNLMDLQYQTYQNYPSKGREYTLTINYTIN